MSRHKRLDRPVSKHARIPTSLWEQVEEELADPVTGKPPHGAYSSLVEFLLRQWIKSRRAQPPNAPPPTAVNLDDLLSP
jgi:hypothetical protein